MIFPKRIQIAVIAALMTLAVPMAHAQSIVVEGLQIMLEDVRHNDDRREVIRLGEQVHQELTDEVDALQEARDGATGFLLQEEDGDLVNLTREEANDLAATLAADLFFAGENRYAVAMGLLNRAENGGDLDYAVGHAVFGVVQQRWEEGKISGDGSAEGQIGEFTNALLNLLEEADARNRAALDEQIEQIHQDRAAISAIITEAEAMGPIIVEDAPDAPEGFMNDPGYYVAQVSGMGWRKGGAGYASQITGYENFIFEVTEEVTEPTQTRYLWQVPPGFDIQVFERLRQEAAEERSRENCAGLPGLGPRDPAPEIWADGPHYELVEGPITDWAEATALRGNPRRNNNDPTGNSFWHHDGDHRWEDLDPVCERYGVDLIED